MRYLTAITNVSAQRDIERCERALALFTGRKCSIHVVGYKLRSVSHAGRNCYYCINLVLIAPIPLGQHCANTMSSKRRSYYLLWQHTHGGVIRDWQLGSGLCRVPSARCWGDS